MIQARKRWYLAISALIAPIPLCSCFSQKIPANLARATILPAVATGREAAANAQPVSLVHPRDLRKDPSVCTNYDAKFFPVVIKQVFIAENDPAVWAGNGLVEGLENAGYGVKRVDSIEGADTPVVIAVDLAELSAVRPSGISMFADCTVKMAVTVRIIKAGQVLSERQYEAEGKQPGGHACLDANALSLAGRKALEALLAKAVPEIALTLRAATQSGGVAGPPS